MGRTLLVALLLIVASGSGVAAQEPPSEPLNAAKALRVGHQPPAVVFSREGWLSRRWETVGVYLQAGALSASGPAWTLRRSVGGREGDPTVSWASSKTCPAVAPVLRQITQFEAPQVDVPGLAPLSDEVSMPPMDGSQYLLWGRGRLVRGEVTVSGNVGSPVANLADGAFKALEPCWSSTSPDTQ